MILLLLLFLPFAVAQQQPRTFANTVFDLPVNLAPDFGSVASSSAAVAPQAFAAPTSAGQGPQAPLTHAGAELTPVSQPQLNLQPPAGVGLSLLPLAPPVTPAPFSMPTVAPFTFPTHAPFTLPTHPTFTFPTHPTLAPFTFPPHPNPDLQQQQFIPPSPHTLVQQPLPSVDQQAYNYKQQFVQYPGYGQQFQTYGQQQPNQYYTYYSQQQFLPQQQQFQKNYNSAAAQGPPTNAAVPNFSDYQEIPSVDAVPKPPGSESVAQKAFAQPSQPVNEPVVPVAPISEQTTHAPSPSPASAGPKISVVSQTVEQVTLDAEVDSTIDRQLWFDSKFDTTECRNNLQGIGARFQKKLPSYLKKSGRDAALATLVEQRLIECERKSSASHWDKVDTLLTKISLSRSEESECRAGLVQERISCLNVIKFACQFVHEKFLFKLIPARITIQEARQAESGAEKCRKVVRLVKKRLEKEA